MVKVILTQNVPGLGVLGDEVQVRPGYARNYLVPKGFALPLNSLQSKQVQHHRNHLEKLRVAAIAEAKGVAEKIKEDSFEVSRKAGETGRLFGSVTNRDLEALLVEKGYEVVRRDITIPEPIKQAGKHRVIVKLHTDVKVDIQVNVKADIDPELLKKAQEAKQAAPSDEYAEDSEEVVDEATAADEDASEEVEA